MPKQPRVRVTPHRLANRPFAISDASAEAFETGASTSVQPDSCKPPHETVTSSQGEETLGPLAGTLPGLSKKEKQRSKHEAFIDELASTVSPYSKTQRRRFNKKMREQVGGGMADMDLALSALQEENPSLEPAKGSDSVTPSSTVKQTVTGQIGKGKGVPLTKAQRKRTLQVENLRHPLILSDPQFASNPFETIRIHAQNTLEKRST
ncbi:ribosome biogenesis protein SLX9-domain-containing protein [Pisolithus croceorrhizus]|nr:ribosome biogenesis protein SLX9-domain-containing protein [Pisolithus croceorrhizus]